MKKKTEGTMSAVILATCDQDGKVNILSSLSSQVFLQKGQCPCFSLYVSAYVWPRNSVESVYSIQRSALFP